MKQLQLLALVGLSVLGTTVKASYEMVMYGGGSQGKVYRYDPITGASLGSFGGGYLSYATGLTLDGTSGNVFVSDFYTNRILKFNYSTGEFISSFNTEIPAYRVTRISDGSLLVGSEGNKLIRYSSSGTKLSEITFPGQTGSLFGECQTSSGFLYAATSTGQLYRVAWGATTGVLTGVTIGGGKAPIGFSSNGNEIAYTTYDDLGFTQILNTTPAGNVTAGASANLTSGLVDAYYSRATCYGHGGIVYALAQNATKSTNSLYRWDPKAGNFSTSFAITGDGYTGTQMVCVVAPEPGTVIALVAGIGACALRRKRR